MRDISDLVPINDNQEIFADVNETNPAYSGNQLIIEILSKTEAADAEAVQFNFNDLAEENGAKDPTILDVKNYLSAQEAATVISSISSVSGATFSLQILKGSQKIIPNKKTVA